MTKLYKFLLLITIIVLGTIWYFAVKKDNFRTEEVSHIGMKLKADTMRNCLHKAGFRTAEEADPETLKKCRILADEKWQEAKELNENL
ncbi:hypothetical protein [Sulfurovum lithotrophicum]|nr:hypothetical protein [Sulfurovum lithotrophicum]